MTTRGLILIGFLVAAVALSGCAAAVIGARDKDLDVQTRLSETIFLEPVSPDKRTVWVEVKSACDEGLDFTPLGGMLTARGYQVVTDPDAAQYQLQITCLSVSKTAIAAGDTPFGKGAVIGMALAGAIAGAAIGDVTGFIGGAIGAGIGEAIMGALVKSVTYTVVTEVQLSERSAVPVTKEQTATLTQGTQTQVREQVATQTTEWKHYRNRVTSTATKVNLTFDEARPLLTERLLRSLAGAL